ncbi:hypothetical protein [Streptomyces sp. IB2014 016-6]|uniref:hypothetical protein n=1 Tax=Streptomyces sp. IB2014 016-6 TaxID=2517818 RepID=UPI0011C92F47|nr:hypothetical protein [Streptomyces sp. IB2014 016-6]TXL85581.1 hypothetical protein EW053_30615 [Streptomyces sp. IB2014 016-6]
MELIMQSQGTDESVEPESQYAFVVYNTGSGEIHHVHRVVNLPGAEVRSREQMEQTALSYVSPQVKEREAADLAVLGVPYHQLERGKSYRVDHEQQVLSAVERQR